MSRNSDNPIRLAVGGGLIASLLGLVGCGASQPGAGSGETLPANVTVISADAGSLKFATPQAALDAALAGVTPGLFSDVHLGDTPPDSTRTGTWLYGNANLTGSDPIRQEPVWEFNLVQGAVAETAQTDGTLSSGVVSSQLTVIQPDGTSTVVVGGSGAVRAGHVYVSATWSDDEIVGKVDAVLDRYGIAPTEITVLHPLGPAVKIVGSVEDVSRLAGTFNGLTSELNGPDDQLYYEGIYLEVDDADGVPIMVTSNSNRVGMGSVFVRPGLPVDLGSSHG